ncbi:MAG: adenylate/guanylate cyclase domain-containing protein [Desulfobacteraceae bacterium]|nr:adenylate/guanylate cyclase domain-containing protein [Desulfobacteraceae bacterium]
MIIFAACLLAEFCYQKDWLLPLDSRCYDSWHHMAGIRSGYDPNVVLAAIDTKTLSAYNEDPWVFWGPYFAKAVQHIRSAGARSIGIDILFTISPETWLQKMAFEGSDLSRTYDIAFREQLNAGGVILAAQAVFSENNPIDIILPAMEYLYSLPDGPLSVGLTNLRQDEDGVIRTFIVKLFDEGQPDTTLGPLIASKAGIAYNVPGISRIRFVGPPGTVPRISFKDLLDPMAKEFDTAKALLKDKIVIIAVEQEGLNDYHLSPYSGGFLPNKSMSLMPGPEIHANIIETLITKKFPRDLLPLKRIIWMFCFVSLGTYLSQITGPKKGIMIIFLLIMASAVLSYLLFLEDIVAPLGNVILGLGTAYLGVLSMRLTREEKERTQLRKTFGPYVSESVLKEIINSEQHPTLGGELLEVTALFSDIRNFTTLSEKLEPEEVVEILNRYYSQVCDMINEHDGIVDKFIGDAVMAIFGAPVPKKDHAQKCITVALEMVKNAKQFQEWTKERFPDRGLPDFNIGVGINSGKALIGNIGSKQRMEYTAIGDTVNIASRLEGMCKTLGWEIVASQKSLKLCKARIKTGEKELITPRGRTGTIKIYEVLDFE